jgi:hypothetical protein
VSKVIPSPIKRFPGSVTIADPLTLPQVEAIEAAVDHPKTLEPEALYYFTVYDKPQMSAMFACVEKWQLQNFPETVNIDTFPMSPRKASHELIKWLFGEILKVYNGELDIPNE